MYWILINEKDKVIQKQMKQFFLALEFSICCGVFGMNLLIKKYLIVICEYFLINVVRYYYLLSEEYLFQIIKYIGKKYFSTESLMLKEKKLYLVW